MGLRAGCEVAAKFVLQAACANEPIDFGMMAGSVSDSGEPLNAGIGETPAD